MIAPDRGFLGNEEIRDAFDDLGDEIASSENATQVGDQFLDGHAAPPNAGTLTVARPIYDHERGTRIMPWEIRPGTLIRVRGIQPNTNSLNATGRDGTTVFSVIGVDYNTDSAAATLEKIAGLLAQAPSVPEPPEPGQVAPLASEHPGREVVDARDPRYRVAEAHSPRRAQPGRGDRHHAVGELHDLSRDPITHRQPDDAGRLLGELAGALGGHDHVRGAG